MAKKTTIFVQQEETVVRRRQTVIKVEASYVQLYKNIRNYTLALSPGSPIDMMLFFITKMNDNNGVQINKTMIEEYISSLPKPITERTFYRTVKVLIKNNVLIPLSRGEYKMNPAIVWQGDIGTRMEHIKFLEEGGVSLKPNEQLLLDKKEDGDGKVTILGNEERAKAAMVIDFGSAEDIEGEVIKNAVSALTGEHRKYPLTEQEVYKPRKSGLTMYEEVGEFEKQTENKETETKLNTDGREQGNWDAPLEYPKPDEGGFKA